MNKLYKIAIAALCLSALSAAAVPARRGPVTVKQPDGTYITVCKTGDEFNHFTTTSDGILLTTNADGIYCYGRLSVSGVVESTGIKAVDAELRSTLPAEAVHFNMQEAMALRRASGLQRRASGNTALGRGEKTFPAMGDVNALILLVEYKDVKFTLDDPYGYFNDMLNKEGFSEYGGTGSCKDYFLDNSNGQFRPHFDVYGPITLSKNRSYYGGNVKGEDAAPREMVSEACELADKEIDFSRYDNDGDGYVDNVFVFYAGQGEADYGPADSVWPHSWNLNPSLTLDNVIISQYACSNEWQEDTPGGIGTFVHEFSHVMGLPDLYSTTYAYPLVCTPGGYSVLDYGPYNNDGRTPPSYSVFERNAMGWLVPEVLSEPANVTLGEIQESNKGYIIPTAKDTEFYLLENRQKKGWDAYLPGHGMLVWHVDFLQHIWDRNIVNDDQQHQYVDIVEANNLADNGDEDAMAGWTWPGIEGKTSFTDSTRPSMRTWSGDALKLPITDIAEADGIISFKVAGGLRNVATPVLDEEIEYSSAHFVPSWQPVEGATDYLLSVYEAGQGESGSVTTDMGANNTLSLGEWTATTQEIYKSSGNFGESSPSLKLAKAGASLQSPVLPGDAVSVKFWYKGQNLDGSTLDIKGLSNGEWINIHTLEYPSNEAAVYEVSDIPAGVTQIRLEYNKVSGNMALDDVEITYGQADKVFMHYDRYSTGGATSVRVDVPQDSGSVFRYQVVASDGTEESFASEMKTVNLLGSNSIDSIGAESAPAEYFDVLGRRVLRPSKGDILIERRGTETRKIVVR